MPTAKFKLANGTEVSVEGSIVEIEKLMNLYGADPTKDGPASNPKTPRQKKSDKTQAVANAVGAIEIERALKESDEAESIEVTILDRISMVDRTLLPLYIVHEYIDKTVGLTSGEISKAARQLGISLDQGNVSRTLSGAASRYVIAHSVRKKGVAVNYSISRQGLKYLRSIITGNSNG